MSLVQKKGRMNQQPAEENSELDNTYLPAVQPSKPEEEGREVNPEITNADETAQTMNECSPQQEGDVMDEEQPAGQPDDVADAHAASDESNG
ncbi:uncharacterized [Tachysurus ichikawai]